MEADTCIALVIPILFPSAQKGKSLITENLASLPFSTLVEKSNIFCNCCWQKNFESQKNLKKLFLKILVGNQM